MPIRVNLTSFEAKAWAFCQEVSSSLGGSNTCFKRQYKKSHLVITSWVFVRVGAKQPVHRLHGGRVAVVHQGTGTPIHQTTRTPVVVVGGGGLILA